MFRSFVFLCCVLTLSLTLFAEGPSYGDPIPAQAWEVQSDPARGLQDAAYLEHFTQLNGSKVQHYRLIRILSEEGKKAAEFEVDKSILKRVRGRVIERDGTITQFERGEDFVNVTTYRSRYSRSRSRLLIPPGLTDDCIVELEWTTRAHAGIELNRFLNRYIIREPYFCIKKVIDVADIDAKSDPRTYLYYHETPGLQASSIDKSRTTSKIEFDNVEPRRNHPFGNITFDPKSAYVLVFNSYYDLGKDPDSFWATYCKFVVKGAFWKFQGSRSQRAWLKALRTDLEAKDETHPQKNPIAAAKVTLEALRQRISTTELLTAEELAAHRDTKTRLPANMERIFRDGRAKPEEFTSIYIHSLRMLGIKEKLVFTTDTSLPPINPAERNSYYIDPYLPLVQVEQDGSRVIFCPWQAAMPAGQYPGNMQGIPGLIVDPHDNWRFKFDLTPIYGPETNQLQTTYRAKLHRDGKLTFNLKRVGTGQYNKALTERYYSLTDEERDFQMRERWQQRLGQKYQLDAVQLEGQHDINQLAVLQLDAQLQLPNDLGWLPITPFPGSAVNLRSPRIWYENRTEPILLDHPFRHHDTMILKVPQDWQLKGRPRWQKSNQVGQVAFAATQEGDTVTIQRMVTLNGHILAADKQEQLRLFLAWIEEVSVQQIGVLKGGA